MLNTKNNFKALSLSTESEVLNSLKLRTCNNEKGRSMIEMLGVLAIIGVLSVGGIAGYSKAMLKYKTNKTIDQITMLTTNIRTLYAQQNNFAGLTEISAVNMGVVPDELIDTGTKDANGLYTAVTLLNPFSGAVTITPVFSVPGDAGNNGAFIIGVDGIPKEACMAAATSDWGSNYSSGLIGMAVTSNYDASKLTDTTMAKQGTAKAASALLETNTETANGKAVYAGSACTGVAITAENKGGSYCAKELPIAVSAAATGCNCTGSTCSIAFKYY